MIDIQKIFQDEVCIDCIAFPSCKDKCGDYEEWLKEKEEEK
jgi:disulfide oxidoreductase YuzD